MAKSIVHWGGLEGLEPELRRYLRRRCRDASEEDDVVQETLLRAARYRPSLLEPDRLGGWSQRIAANVLRDRRRRESRLARAECGAAGLDALPDPVDCVADEERLIRVGGLELELGVMLGHLERALRGLRERDRRVLRSYYQGGGETARVARELGIARGLVKVRLYRARQRLGVALRQRLAEAGPGGRPVARAGARPGVLEGAGPGVGNQVLAR
jgi:RNA polymerase sigma-70 factor (ECF subfamily)